MKAGVNRGARGQATTETVLLFPIFLFFLFAFAKIFALLVLVQKMEIASYYGARRWQLESHRNFEYSGFDDGTLHDDIESNIGKYLGFGSKTEKFLNLTYLSGNGPSFKCERTQVWNVCTLEVKTAPVLDVGWMYKSQGMDFSVTKYVPNRDRPIAFVLPGLQQ
ncbi:MAG: hypothetical protein HY077_03355 [Elusimicrobia bacterium]|nr:hypothetical protein [Elusimicrobiota bacterium]